jgi:hypothetical protein
MPAPGLLVSFYRWRGSTPEPRRPERILTRHDTRVVPRAQLYNEHGVALVLTGFTVRYTLKDRASGTVKVNRATVTLEDQTLYPGMCYYQVVAADMDTAGTYSEEWEVDYGSGSKETFPASATPQTVTVLGDLDNV